MEPDTLKALVQSVSDRAFFCNTLLINCSVLLFFIVSVIFIAFWVQCLTFLCSLHSILHSCLFVVAVVVFLNLK